ncbi:MAG: 4a-hydroxytetrahydrobiopterin dehydratase [Patescibacteria group bacterium]|nr:4a-hydroxytetrahydrobiopterin dehydratase [Patescibacteria group bacterium]
MTTKTTNALRAKRCVACEGEATRLSKPQARELLASLEGWKMDENATQIRKQWKMDNFAAGLDFFQRVGDLAEQEGHHPDVHLTGYRNVAIELSTHAVDGLSENDFILASKIDELPAGEQT